MQRIARVTLVEYGTPRPVIADLSTQLQMDRSQVRHQLSTAGARVAHVLGLKDSPLSVSDSGVRVCDVAGVLRVGPRVELEVAPKFLGTEWAEWREDFLFLCMLSRNGRLLAGDKLRASSTGTHDLASLVAEAMVSMYLDVQRRPLRSYRHEWKEEFALDGDVDPDEIVLPSTEGFRQRVVLYDRRNAFNATILRACMEILPEVREPRTRQRVQRMVGALAPQRVEARPRRRRLPSRARHWASLYDLSLDVLAGFRAEYAPGSALAPGYVVNTWRVWEDLVTLALRTAWPRGATAEQRSFRLGARLQAGEHGAAVLKAAWVTPDAFLTGGAGMVCDAKYKGRLGEKRARISEADLYEALAFASATKCKRVVLLYPMVPRSSAPPEPGTTSEFERVSVEDVEVIGLEAEVRGIARRGAFRSFAARLADAIKKLATVPQ